MDDGEVEVADEEDERDVEQRVVQRHGAREAVARVALPEPEEQAGDKEESRKRRREDRIDLLADQPLIELVQQRLRAVAELAKNMPSVDQFVGALGQLQAVGVS